MWKRLCSLLLSVQLINEGQCVVKVSPSAAVFAFHEWNPDVCVPLPFWWCQWPHWTGSEDSALHHSQCCRTPPLHRPRGTETSKHKGCLSQRNSIWNRQSHQMEQVIFGLFHLAATRDCILLPLGNLESNSSYLSHQHLIDEDTQPPPVYCSGVGGISQDFWGQKFWSSAKCAGPVPEAHSCKGLKWNYWKKIRKKLGKEKFKVYRRWWFFTFFTQSKVSDLHVSVCVQ